MKPWGSTDRSNSSLFHVPSEELPRVLRELCTALKPRGVLFSSNPRGNNEEGFSDDRYACFFDLDTWRDFVTSAGFVELDHLLSPAWPTARQATLARDRLAQDIARTGSASVLATLPGYRAWLAAACANPDRLYHAIRDNAEGQAVGVAVYQNCVPTMGTIEIGGLVFSPRLQRRPAATEAMFLMMRRVFDELGYRRYEWKCDSLNLPSRAAAVRLGFQYEGLFRQAMITRGRNRDTAWFSVIDRDRPALRAAFERWLDPGNFAADGTQRRRLADL